MIQLLSVRQHVILPFVLICFETNTKTTKMKLAELVKKEGKIFTGGLQLALIIIN